MPHSFQPSVFSKASRFPLGFRRFFQKEGCLERMRKVPLEPSWPKFGSKLVTPRLKLAHCPGAQASSAHFAHRSARVQALLNPEGKKHRTLEPLFAVATEAHYLPTFEKPFDSIDQPQWTLILPLNRHCGRARQDSSKSQALSVGLELITVA